MDHDQASPDPAAMPDLLERVHVLEQSLARFTDEVRTARLVIVDPDGGERIVTDVGESFAELRLRVGSRRQQVDVVVFAAREPPGAGGTTTAGLEVWLDGDHVGGFTITADR